MQAFALNHVFRIDVDSVILRIYIPSLNRDHGCMETTSDSGADTMFALWHIPSSTLLVSTVCVNEVRRRIEALVSDGVVLSELMLNVERCGAVVGDQHIGAHMLIALRTSG